MEWTFSAPMRDSLAKCICIETNLLSFFDFVEQLDQELVIERDYPKDDTEERDSEWPNVTDFAIVSSRHFFGEHFWRHEVICALTAHQLLLVVLELHRPAEVDDLHILLFVDEDVLGFYVSVNDIDGMNYVNWRLLYWSPSAACLKNFATFFNSHLQWKVCFLLSQVAMSPNLQ